MEVQSLTERYPDPNVRVLDPRFAKYHICSIGDCVLLYTTTS